MLFVGGERILLAVNRSSGRGKHHALQSVLARGLDQVQKSDDINLRVEGRIRDGAPHVHLRGHMINRLGPLARDDLAHRGRVAKIHLMQPRLRIDLMALAGRQIVEDRDIACALFDQRIDRMRPDKARAAGYENSHRNFPALRPESVRSSSI